MTRKGTTTLIGKSHSAPREFIDFVAELEVMEGVEQVKTQKYRNRPCGQQDIGARIQYYDSTTRTLRIGVQSARFFQYFNIRVSDEESKKELKIMC